ncbi:MAG: glycosyl transferase [Muribaculaceae bacterium]|nr:glycosyl transferase [Muribaculaceae bacterium]
MIPKILHYCWFGRGEKPADFLKFLESWRRACPDYEIREWNEDNFDVNINSYCREAYLTRNFAHVSDVCRVWVLLTHGGVYLDTDVEVYRDFGPLLHLDSFLGVESTLVGTGVMGSVPRAEWLKAFMQYYDSRHFLSWWGHTVRTPNTKILTQRVLPKVDIVEHPTILPRRFLACRDWDTGRINVTPDTFSMHFFAASWRRKKTLKQKIAAIRAGLAIRYFKRSTAPDQGML